MASYFLKFHKYFPLFFIFRSLVLVMNFDRYFGDILSFLSSNIGNEGKTFNSSCNTDHRRCNFDIDICLIISILVIPAMLFINYKLFLVVRKSRKNKRMSTDMKNALSLKNISSCLLVVACVVVLSIPMSVNIGLRINSPETKISLDNANLAAMWVKTIALINCTFITV